MKQLTKNQMDRYSRESDQLQVTLAPPRAIGWLRRGSPAKVLHVFSSNINLVDQNGAILSLVNPKIGPGPFSAVVERQAVSYSESVILDVGNFTNAVDVHSVVAVTGSTLVIGRLAVEFAAPIYWNPEPDWHKIEEADWSRAAGTIERIIAEKITYEGGFFFPMEGQLPAFRRVVTEAWSYLSAGLRQLDPVLCRSGAGLLAGLGSGFTPAGDDFLVGVIYALYAVARRGSAQHLGTIIAEEARPKTTRLSSAWLSAASRGEATEAWHSLVAALAMNDSHSLPIPTILIKQTGHSSGVAALAGFVNGFKVLLGTA